MRTAEWTPPHPRKDSLAELVRNNKYFGHMWPVWVNELAHAWNTILKATGQEPLEQEDAVKAIESLMDRGVIGLTISTSLRAKLTLWDGFTQQYLHPSQMEQESARLLIEDISEEGSEENADR